jgi:hypothetical protein
MKNLISFLLVLTPIALGQTTRRLPNCPGTPSALWNDCIGTFTAPNGDKFVGEYHNNMMHGQGTYEFATGTKYVGEFDDGEFSGQGTYTSTTGIKYVGTFRNGKYDGWGTLTSPNGARYIGEFHNGKYDGQGTLMFSNGTQQEGLFIEGDYIGPSCPKTPTSYWDKCVGRVMLSNGDSYVAKFREGKLGYGTYTFSNGDKYVGELRDGPLINGQGVRTWSEIQNVPLDEQGYYTVLLGAMQPNGLPLDLFTTGKARWLGVQPQLAGVAEQPRVLLVGVPYALKAADADTLGGQPASAFLRVPVVAGPPAGASGASPELASKTIPNQACASITSDGTAEPNQIAMFTTPCNLEPSAISQSGSSIGIDGFVFNGTGGGYNYVSLPYNYYIVGAGNTIGGIGYNWYYNYNGGSPMYYKPVADTSIWWELSNTAAALKYNTGTTAGSMSPSTAMTVTNTGNVGIGTTNPAANLEVNGTAKFDSLVSFAALITFGKSFQKLTSLPCPQPALELRG